MQQDLQFHFIYQFKRSTKRYRQLTVIVFWQSKENKSICHQYLHVLRSACANASNINIFCIWWLLVCSLCPTPCSVCQRGFWVSLTVMSCPGPPEWWPPHFHNPFLRGQFSFLHGVSWVAPSTLLSPIGMCSVQCCLLDRAFSGVSISPRQLLAPCASPLGGWPTARTPLLHTPSSIPPRGHCPPSFPHFTWPWMKPAALIGYQIPS